VRKLSLANTVLGRPLASDEEDQQRLGVAAGIPVFGLDALSSAAYGPEAALTMLLPLGAAGAGYILPITGAICVLLGIVYLSYRQTIAAYPSGGGSYTVAHENLGAQAGLLAAAALMIDYLLNVAVGISAGVGAIISALPILQPHTLSLCLIITADPHDRKSAGDARGGPSVHGSHLHFCGDSPRHDRDGNLGGNRRRWTSAPGRPLPRRQRARYKAPRYGFFCGPSPAAARR
jgi:hypothetical protein